MLSTGRAVTSSPACARRSSESSARRLCDPLRCSSARAPGANTTGCLEAAERAALPACLKVATQAPGDAVPAVPSEQRVREVVLKQAVLAAARPRTEARNSAGGMDAAFHRCGEVCREYARHSTLVSQKDTVHICFYFPVDLNTPTYSFDSYLKIKGLTLYMFMVVEE
jgi:15-cis-phytoene synthase